MFLELKISVELSGGVVVWECSLESSVLNRNVDSPRGEASLKILLQEDQGHTSL